MEKKEVEAWFITNANEANEMAMKLQRRWQCCVWGCAFTGTAGFFTEGWWQAGAIFVTICLFLQALRDMSASNAFVVAGSKLIGEYHLLRVGENEAYDARGNIIR